MFVKGQTMSSSSFCGAKRSGCGPRCSSREANDTTIEAGEAQKTAAAHVWVQGYRGP